MSESCQVEELMHYYVELNRVGHGKAQEVESQQFVYRLKAYFTQMMPPCFTVELP